MVDERRIAAYEHADDALVARLRQQGDDPSKPRPVDVRFKGPKPNLQRFADGLGRGWTVVRLVDLKDGVWALDIQREQTTDRAAIRRLTDGAIGVEMQHGIEYDGWGCVVQP